MNQLLHLYISGPISNGEKLAVGSLERKRNEEEFFKAEVALDQKHHWVENPMRLHVNHPNRTWEDKLRIDIGVLVQCDGIVLLDGWNGSTGSTLEWDIARRLGMLLFHSVNAVPYYTPVEVDGKL